MCGIFSVFSHHGKFQVTDEILDHFKSLEHRGPDSSMSYHDENVFLGFHRLSINDLSAEGNQPMFLECDAASGDGVYLICNGEIYNHHELVAKHGFKVKSASDSEVILHLYKMLASDASMKSLGDIMSALCNALDGEFAFVLYDPKRKALAAARDPFGVRPMFIGVCEDATICLASELKGINGLVEYADAFMPGHFMTISCDVFSWQFEPYHNQPGVEAEAVGASGSDLNYEAAKRQVNALLREAVCKRVRNSDRRVCSLLSGGLDSSLVAAIAAEQFEPYTFETFSIGFHGSPDLAASQVVADHIKSKHTIVEVTPQDFLDAIPETVRICESYDTTTVRASVGNYLVSKYIREHTDNKVVLNGDYSDEVTGGYLYLRNCHDEREFAADCRRLVKEIYLFDSLRSDRTICSMGLEARTPFSDKAFVDYYQSLPASWRMSNRRMEKSLLREAFDDGGKLLPNSILWRQKEAFSDAVSTPENSWHMIVKRHIDALVTNEDLAGRATEFPFNTPQLKETLYYRRLFHQHYSHANVITHYWLPRFSGEMVDPSARELGNIRAA